MALQDARTLNLWYLKTIGSGEQRTQELLIGVVKTLK